jgi:putative transposase
MARPSLNLGITAEERRELEAIAASRSLPHGLVRRAQMILWSQDGMSLEEIARRARVTPAAVSNWRRRFRQARVAGLHDALKSGRPRALDDERVAQLLSAALLREPDTAPHWTVRALAQETGVAKSSVQRYLARYGVAPRRPHSCLPSADPCFVARVWDIVGLYLNPPDHALLLCADAGIATPPTAPAPPLHWREPAAAALPAPRATAPAVALAGRPRKRHQDLQTFLRQADATVHVSLQVHVLIDAAAAHQHPRLRAWLESRPRFTLHAMPSHAVWLGEVERWFGIIIQRALREGAFDSAEKLRRRIEDFGACCASRAAPFEWTDSVKPIMQKLLRLNKAISGTAH